MSYAIHASSWIKNKPFILQTRSVLIGVGWFPTANHIRSVLTRQGWKQNCFPEAQQPSNSRLPLRSLLYEDTEKNEWGKCI